MNTKLNIKAWRSRFIMIAINLLVGVVVVLALGDQSAQAQGAATIAAEPAATVESSLTISSSGTVNDPNGAFSVSGSVVVNCKRVLDTTGTTPPLVVLDFDFSKLQGTSGNGKSLKVYVTGDNHGTEIRPLQTSDTIVLTAPYYESTKDALSARSMLVTATLNFDVSTGKLTSGSIFIGNNIVTTAEVGSFTIM